MRIVGIATLLLLVDTQLRAQIPASSPALDPDFVILQPKEEFTGRYANQMVGATIKTIAPLRWDIPEGGVFLNNVDTAGFSGLDIEREKPAGPFRQHSQFSLFDRALYRIKGLTRPTMLFTKGPNHHPVIAGGKNKIIGGDAIAFIFPDSQGKYSEDSVYYPYTLKAFIFATESSAISKANLDGDSLDDFIAIERESDDDSTNVGIWYDEDINYKGDSIFNRAIIPASDTFKIPNKYNWINRNDLHVGDFDKDGITDFCFFGGNVNGGFQKGVAFVFGKSVNQKWSIDTIVATLHPAIKNFKFMDFLYEDNVQDLLIGTNDTIYCFSGDKPNFLRNGFSFSDADFKLPSPGKLDPNNWGQPDEFVDFGLLLFDAGDINGSGVHSIATTAVKFLGGLDGIPYFFVYSGGKAADEKVDAIYAEPAGIYNAFANLDTVNIVESPTDIILGDWSYNAGTVGKIWYFLGDKSIPHKPNPKWKVEKTNHISAVGLRVQYAHHVLSVSISTQSSSDGILTLRDLLGRTVYRHDLYYYGNDERTLDIGTDKLAKGVYIVTYEQGNTAVSQKVCVVEFSESPALRFLPEQWHAFPFVPAYAFTVSDEYLSRRVTTMPIEQMRELRKIRQETPPDLYPEEYQKRMRQLTQPQMEPRPLTAERAILTEEKAK